MDDNDFSDSDNPELKALWNEQASVEERLNKAQNDENMAVWVLGLMDTYSNRMQPQHTESSKLKEFLEQYVEWYVMESERHCKAKAQVSKEEKKIKSLLVGILKVELQL